MFQRNRDRDVSFSISFHFKDGSKLEHAFEYHWRFFRTIAEVRELLDEACSSESGVYWDMEDDEDWQRLDETESTPCWISHIVAKK